MSSIYAGDAFKAAARRSETTRIRWTLAALAVIAIVALVRELVFDDGDVVVLAATITLSLVAIGFEAAMLVRIRRAEPTTGYWRWNTIAEALFPSLVLAVMVSMPEVGPEQGLTAPAIGLYYLAVLLSVLRLRPGLSALAGAIAAFGYAGVVIFAHLVYDSAPPRPGIYATHAVFMLVAGFVAGAVASRIRDYLVASIREAEERQRSRLETRNTLIFGLAKLAEYRDTDTGAHLERISEYAALLGQELRSEHDEINDPWIETLRVASSLHDIGKVGVPDAVLKKPGRLTDEEHKVIQQHTALGADAISAIRGRHGQDDLLEMSEDIARCHHERWDGAGYPNGVKADEIPLAARIISVADVYDALTSVRVYKPAMSHEKATEIIVESRGTQFDPGVVDAFQRAGAAFDAIRGRHHDQDAG